MYEAAHCDICAAQSLDFMAANQMLILALATFVEAERRGEEGRKRRSSRYAQSVFQAKG